nr:hypothetical protein Iba_chr10eCG10120 [Ipomoea batatas]
MFKTSLARIAEIEAVAVLKAMEWAWSKGFRNIEIRSDSREIVKRLDLLVTYLSLFPPADDDRLDLISPISQSLPPLLDLPPRLNPSSKPSRSLPPLLDLPPRLNPSSKSSLSLSENRPLDQLREAPLPPLRSLNPPPPANTNSRKHHRPPPQHRRTLPYATPHQHRRTSIAAESTAPPPHQHRATAAPAPHHFPSAFAHCQRPIREREEGGFAKPPKRASAAARALTPCSSINLFAVGMKYSMDSEWTPPRLTTTCSADDPKTSLTDGGLTKSNLHPTSRSRDLTVRLWLLVNIRIALPSFPARPVRPERCTKVSGSLGSS